MEQGYGGPVWHASAAPLPGWALGPDALRQCALAAIDGVGDGSLGEWDEWTGRAYHVRRRLSMTEEKSVGPVVDIRGTSEAHKRLARLLPLFKGHPDALRVVAEEAGLEVLP